MRKINPPKVVLLPMKPGMLKGHLDGLLLCMLEAGPMHGYAVIEALKARSGGRLALPTGTVYPALQRLDNAGLVSTSWSTVSGRRRRTYQLTAAGRRALEVERGAWRDFAAAVAPILEGLA
jgi:PadR family transcriptional regulator, regulatory protein PadR